MASASVPSKDNRVDVSFLSESESEAEDASVHSDPIADYVPSETSNDRAFVVSDTEEQSSHASSNDFANDGILARRDEMDSKAMQKVRVPAFRPWRAHRAWQPLLGYA